MNIYGDEHIGMEMNIYGDEHVWRWTDGDDHHIWRWTDGDDHIWSRTFMEMNGLFFFLLHINNRFRVSKPKLSRFCGENNSQFSF